MFRYLKHFDLPKFLQCKTLVHYENMLKFTNIQVLQPAHKKRLPGQIYRDFEAPNKHEINANFKMLGLQNAKQWLKIFFILL